MQRSYQLRKLLCTSWCSGSWNAKGHNSKFSRFKINRTPQYLILCVHHKGAYTHIVRLIYLPFLYIVRNTLLIVTRNKNKNKIVEPINYWFYILSVICIAFVARSIPSSHLYTDIKFKQK